MSTRVKLETRELRGDSNGLQELASKMRDSLETLAQDFAARLKDVPGYAELPDRARLDAAKQTVRIVATCLEGGDQRTLAESIQVTLASQAEQESGSEVPVEALIALEKVVTPLVDTAEAAKFMATLKKFIENPYIVFTSKTS